MTRRIRAEAQWRVKMKKYTPEETVTYLLEKIDDAATSADVLEAEAAAICEKHGVSPCYDYPHANGVEYDDNGVPLLPMYAAAWLINGASDLSCHDIPDLEWRVYEAAAGCGIRDILQQKPTTPEGARVKKAALAHFLSPD